MNFSIRTLFVAAGLTATMVAFLQAWWPRTSSISVDQSTQRFVDQIKTATLYDFNGNSEAGAILLVVVEQTGEPSRVISYDYPINIAGKRFTCRAGKLQTILVREGQILIHMHPIESATTLAYRKLFERGASEVATAMERAFSEEIE